MENAIFGFVGVLVGALIAAGSNYFVARRGENVAVERERMARAVEIKTAARLIHADLRWAAALGPVFIEKREWWHSRIEVSTDAWVAYRHTLAPELLWKDWLAVVVAVMAVKHLSDARSFAADAGTLKEEMPTSTVVQLTPMIRDVQAGLDALATLVREEST